MHSFTDVFDFEDANMVREIIKKPRPSVADALYMKAKIKTLVRFGNEYEFEKISEEPYWRTLERCENILLEWRRDFADIIRLYKALSRMNKKYDIRIGPGNERWEVCQNGGIIGVIKRKEDEKCTGSMNA